MRSILLLTYVDVFNLAIGATESNEEFLKVKAELVSNGSALLMIPGKNFLSASNFGMWVQN